MIIRVSSQSIHPCIDRRIDVDVDRSVYLSVYLSIYLYKNMYNHMYLYMHISPSLCVRMHAFFFGPLWQAATRMNGLLQERREKLIQADFHTGFVLVWAAHEPDRRSQQKLGLMIL